MSQLSSRKSFLARLLGTAAVAGLAPKLPAQLVSHAAPSPGSPAAPPTPFAIRPEARAVARQG